MGFWRSRLWSKRSTLQPRNYLGFYDVVKVLGNRGGVGGLEEKGEEGGLDQGV